MEDLNSLAIKLINRNRVSYEDIGFKGYFEDLPQAKIGFKFPVAGVIWDKPADAYNDCGNISRSVAADAFTTSSETDNLLVT